MDLIFSYDLILMRAWLTSVSKGGQRYEEAKDITAIQFTSTDAELRAHVTFMILFYFKLTRTLVGP